MDDLDIKMERYLWLDSQHRWHRGKRRNANNSAAMRWHFGQERWYLRAMRSMMSVTLMVTMTYRKHMPRMAENVISRAISERAPRFAENIASNNVLLERLRRVR